MTREEALDVMNKVLEASEGHEVSILWDLDDSGLELHDCWDWCVTLARAAQVLAQPVPCNSRWVILPFNSGSGKTLWRCGVCGRLSNTPDKRCPDKWPCEEYDGEPGIMNPAPEDFR